MCPLNAAFTEPRQALSAGALPSDGPVRVSGLFQSFVYYSKPGKKVQVFLCYIIDNITGRMIKYFSLPQSGRIM